ncbi:MAG: MFS transporter [Streptosporangiaceae bacterium]
MTAAAPPRATFRDVFAVREFRSLWLSVILSAAGDRLALVALAVLVYDRTRSPLLAALAYAAGYLPWVIGGLFLADLADRRPRRSVMVACDAVRAVLVAAMTVPGMPVAALVLLLFAATMFASPFESARSSITPGILPGERYALGTAVMQTSYLTAEVLGAAAGGAVVTLFGVRPSLLIDAVTFVASGLLIGLGTRARPAAARPDAGQGSPLARAAAGLRLVFGDRALRTLVLLGWLIVLYTIPQGIAAPYAARLGGGPVATGLVLASTAAATAIATPLFSRFVSPRRRSALMGPLAAVAGATLVLTALHPGLVVSLVIFSAAAASGAYQLAVNTAFVVRVPDERRAQAFGIASMGIVVAQGAAFVAAGAVAEVVTPASVIAVGGGIGAAAAVVLTFSWRRVTSSQRTLAGCPVPGVPDDLPSGEVMAGEVMAGEVMGGSRAIRSLRSIRAVRQAEPRREPRGPATRPRIAQRAMRPARADRLPMGSRPAGGIARRGRRRRRPSRARSSEHEPPVPAEHL